MRYEGRWRERQMSVTQIENLSGPITRSWTPQRSCQSFSRSQLLCYIEKLYRHSRTVTLVIVALTEAEGERNKDKSTFMTVNNELVSQLV